MKHAICGLIILIFAAPLIAAERIITVAPHLTELACAAGACDKLVGVDSRSDYPSQVMSLSKIGDAFSLNLEAILALKPDLILAWDGGSDKQMVQRLAKLGLHVEWIRVSKLDEIADVLLKIGKLTGTDAFAIKAAETYRSRLQQLRLRTQPPHRLSVLYQIGAQPIYTVSRQSPINEAIEICGGKNIFADLRQIAGVVSLESVLARNPDVVLFEQDAESETIKQQWARWPMITAVKHNALYATNASLLTRATPRMLDGIEQLCTLLDRARQKS